MKRLEFVDCLKVVSPAVASISTLPELTQLWFDGTRLMAFNDSIAIMTPCASGFKGGIPGDALQALVQLSKAKDIEFEVTGGEEGGTLATKIGRSRIKFAIMPLQQGMDILPKVKSDTAKRLKVEAVPFLSALADCMESIGMDTSRPDTLGVTLDIGKQLQMFSTNGETITQAVVKNKGEMTKQRVVLTATFCQQILRLIKPSDELHLELHKDHALLIIGKTVVYGRLLFPEQPLDFANIISQHVKEGDTKFVALPQQLQSAVARALVITHSKVEQIRTNFTVKDSNNGKVLVMLSKREHIEVRDSIRIDDDHPPVSVATSCVYIKRGLEMQQILITKRCVIMRKPGTTYYVAVMGAE